MPYAIKHRQSGGYLAKSPYPCIDARYLYSSNGELPEGAVKFACYVDAFNYESRRTCDMIVEI